MQQAGASTLHTSSPLDTLVRRTSSRRANLPRLTTPPRPGDLGAPEYSPILHTRFRGSTTTCGTVSGHERNNSDAPSTFSWAVRDDLASEDSHDPHLLNPYSLNPAEHRGHSMVESVYSQASYDLNELTSGYRDSWRNSERPREASRQSTPEAIPTVVVSGDTGHEPRPYAGQGDMAVAGRIPSRIPAVDNHNFSRPSLGPTPMDNFKSDEERKLEVLRRNQQRRGKSPSASPGQVPPHQQTRSPLSQYEQNPDPNRPPSSMSMNSRGAPSPQPSPHRAEHLRTRSPVPPQAPPPTTAPPRPPSASTLYSSYSYYQLDPESAPPSPNPHSPAAHSSVTLIPNYAPSPKSPAASAPAPATPVPVVPSKPETPEQFLQLGIQHHEANRLTESAVCFEKAATLQGGCGVGMLMWGLAQRHGWGCTKSEQAGFRWLRRAAETAVEDLEKSRKGINTGAVKSELILAIYEVGQSFYHGWGVEKDKQMAVSYFRVAARLGDPDAQQELGFCLANGKGCKKDKKEAAYWYREAVTQGASDVGLAWIYKEKYQSDGRP
ncbi:HCP-like protein [Wolfiporia cocos MD-104 SS10]|uniref:HCP-like protein n=1 Tax=Wolfiporia cocos (strain MD-104) TaxID=742152 RepID=A0A2H3JAX0_WOLCO|nr:HCP-like protein [Wolfiporia cocos MD-104 SS10]